MFLFLFHLLRTPAWGLGGGGLPEFSSFPCSADRERDWPPCIVVFGVSNQYAEKQGEE